MVAVRTRCGAESQLFALMQALLVAGGAPQQAQVDVQLALGVGAWSRVEHRTTFVNNALRSALLIAVTGDAVRGVQVIRGELGRLPEDAR